MTTLGPDSLRALAYVWGEAFWKAEQSCMAHADAWGADLDDAHSLRLVVGTLQADNAALRERLEAAMVLLTENVVAEWEMGDCCTYCGGIATYTAKGDGSPGTWNVNHRQDCRYIALASQEDTDAQD